MKSQQGKENIIRRGLACTWTVYSVLVCCAALAVPARAQESGLAGLRTVSNEAKPNRAALTPEDRGDIFMARKMYREAVEAYRAAPETAIIDNKIGMAFHQLSRLDLAEKSYAKAVKLDPQYPSAINNLGIIFYAQQRYRKAIVYYKRSLKYSHDRAAVYVNLGTAYFACHKFSKASGYYEEALRLDPDILERRGTFGTYVEDRSVRELAMYHLYLARAYAERGADERALQYIRKALEEGLADRQKLPEVPEFSSLRKVPAFQELLAENPKSL